MAESSPLRVTGAVALLLSILGLAWAGGASVTSLQKDVAVISVEQANHAAYEALHSRMRRKLDRVELMQEMALRGMGIKPPNKLEE